MVDERALEGAWKGRISGCQLGKPVEVLSMRRGHDALRAYLADNGALPLRGYVPWDGSDEVDRRACRDEMTRAEPDDDINYSVLALMLLEQHGRDLTTEDVARAWLKYLPFGSVFTAERAAYSILTARGAEWFTEGAPLGFDLDECSDNPYNRWIGAQIRADVYGWVSPGDPAEAARLARLDARLSHREEGVDGAIFVAACGAAIPVSDSLAEAVARAALEIPEGSLALEAIELGRAVVGADDAVARLRAHYPGLSPVHTLNNLAVVVWALLSHPDDFGAAIGEAVAAGWDTDCNGATVGALWGLTGNEIPARWTAPWRGEVGLSLAGVSSTTLSDLVGRTVAVAETIA